MRLFALGLSLSLGLGSSSAQEAARARELARDYEHAVELYSAGKYAVAEQAFTRLESEYSSQMSARAGDAAYYAAMCAIHLERKDADYRLSTFLYRYPASQHVNDGRFALANSYYRHRRWRSALAWYDQIEDGTFSQEQADEVLFKRAYSLLSLGDTAQAFPLFAQVRTRRSYYTAPATYYYGHIAYTRGHYGTALECFEALKEDESFAPIVPYYIAQIYYQQGKYQEIVDYLGTRVGEFSGKRAREMLRILVDAYSRLGRYVEALPLAQRFAKQSGGLSREESYLVGFVLYRNARYSEAIPHLARVVSEPDPFTQNASYHLADCFLKQGDKPRARKALGIASDLEFDPAIQEDALFNFAQLTYEARAHPFVDAIDAFERYLRLFPDRGRADQANTYLGMAFSASRNYQKALDALARIKESTPATRRAMQRAAYFRGVELLQNARPDQAVARFSTSIENAHYDPALRARALYWRGESYYRMGEYPLALKDYREFYISPGAFSQEEYSLAPYNIGYSYFKMQDYAPAVEWLRRFTEHPGGKGRDLRADGYSRLGDCYYMQRKYWPAIEAYGKADRAGGQGADYGLFQKGMTLGLVDRPAKKIETLSQMEARYPQSVHLPQALYEVAYTKQGMSDLPGARADYLSLASRFPSSRFAPRALVQGGLACFASSDYDGAVVLLQRAIVEYPGTPAMHEALTALERVYNAKGDVAGYLDFLDGVGQEARVSQDQRDSLYFQAAEAFYLRGVWDRAQEALAHYLATYPRGKHSLEANFYLGDCLLRGGDSARALEPLRVVQSRRPNEFYERSLVQTGGILLGQREWEAAYTDFTDLERVATDELLLQEARLGRLRAAVGLPAPLRVIESANALLSSERLPPEHRIFATYHLARALEAQGRIDAAYDRYVELGQNTGSNLGAEARFQMARLRFEQHRWQDVKTIVLAFSKQQTPHQYWLGRAFVLLGLSYMELGDHFQAKATLRSILDHYGEDHDGVKEEAREALHRVMDDEERGVGRASADTIPFQFRSGGANP